MEARQLPILQSMHHIWIYIMSMFYKRRHKTQKHEKYTDFTMAYFQKELDDSRQYLVILQERNNMVALVHRATALDRSSEIVQLQARKYTCLIFQDYRIPCRYIIAVARFFSVKLEDYIAKYYEISEYRYQYKYSPTAVLLDELEPDGVTRPPLRTNIIKRGCPITKQIKRTTRKTEACKRANLVLGSTRVQS